MLAPIEVRALPGYKLHIRYADGVTGEVDLSHLVGKGVFSLWTDPQEFEKVHIVFGGGIAWNEDVELCPDSLYMEITGSVLKKSSRSDAEGGQSLRSVGWPHDTTVRLVDGE